MSAKTQSLASTQDGAEKPTSPADKKRQDIARHAAVVRWTKERELMNKPGAIPEARYSGTLVLGDSQLPCANLDNGMRVLSERGVTKALGGKRGGSHWKRQHASPDGEYLPVFLSAGNLSQFISPSLRIALAYPILYKGKNGQIAYGVPATLLGEICRVFRRADRAEALVGDQKQLAAMAEVLYDGFADVGITSLVDAATGYEKVRDTDELYQILEAYISEALLPWTRRFPEEFYSELFRLRGWTYSPPSPKRPKLVGLLTKQLIYEKLPPGVLEALEQRNPNVEGRGRRYKHFQFLTEEIGDKNLAAQVTSVTTLMKVSRSWNEFKRLFERASRPPEETFNYQMQLNDPEDDDEDVD